jgi:hypothetical protein
MERAGYKADASAQNQADWSTKRVNNGDISTYHAPGTRTTSQNWSIVSSALHLESPNENEGDRRPRKHAVGQISAEKASKELTDVPGPPGPRVDMIFKPAESEYKIGGAIEGCRVAVCGRARRWRRASDLRGGRDEAPSLWIERGCGATHRNWNEA